jgi:hypothetical protein
MPRKCTVCTHPKQADIDQALLENLASIRGIAIQYKLSKSAVMRHRAAHLSERLAAVAERNADADVRQALDVIAHLREINEATKDVLKVARDNENHGLALRAIDRLQQQIELQAKLINLINDAPTINVIVSPQWIELRTIIIAALEDYPEARQHVAQALQASERKIPHEST